MPKECDHIVLVISGKPVTQSQASKAIEELASKVADFNIRGLFQQIPHPGFVQSVKFCAHCGQAVSQEINWEATLKKAIENYDCKGVSKLETAKNKELGFFKQK